MQSPHQKFSCHSSESRCTNVLNKLPLTMKNCGLCGQNVFLAECVQGFGRVWHQHCFVCSVGSCGKLLDSLTACEHKQALYCHQCYNRTVGTLRSYHGLRPTVTHISSADEAAHSYKIYDQKNAACYQNSKQDRTNESISRTSVEQKASKFETTFTNEAKKCPKCEKTVYDAEKVSAAGNVWHKNTCFTCTVCSKRLESRSLCERKGQLFCNVCYGKQFGPRIYGHGSAFINVL
ncbi:hypothetical protein QR680_001863 [Steinernema hermaphroditum]|uniref:Cysteine-rich protein 1 n=1 Tax=Steinernema hermaphroditum TaxID=289476 RepID=A0AA39H0A4_9BILA|nr:hypothetical protein QR680_001863 [Steinernema hermaphroditum]